MAFICVFSVAAPYSVPPASAEESLEDLRHQIDEIEKENVGTDIVLHIDADAEEYLKKERIEELLYNHSYCTENI